jgi:hypothetical protein
MRLLEHVTSSAGTRISRSVFQDSIRATAITWQVQAHECAADRAVHTLLMPRT